MSDTAAITSVREEAIARTAELRRLYPKSFAVSVPRRLAIAAFVAAVAGLAAYAMVRFDFSFDRVMRGLWRMGDFTFLMFPPSPEGRLAALLQGMKETVAIAFLGTLTAALLAFPFALLAAKNIIPNIFVHFTARRGFDLIRSIDVLI